MNVTKRIWMMVLMGLLTLGGQAQVIIETPHNRTVSNTERTMYYDITAKNAGTLSATVSTDATAWLSASLPPGRCFRGFAAARGARPSRSRTC